MEKLRIIGFSVTIPKLFEYIQQLHLTTIAIYNGSLGSLEDSFGIVGTVAGDDTVLIILSDSRYIQDLTVKITDLFELDY